MALKCRVPSLRVLVLLLVLNVVVFIGYWIIRLRFFASSAESYVPLDNTSVLSQIYKASRITVEKGVEVFNPSFVPRLTHDDLFTEFDDEILNGLYETDEYIYDLRLDKHQEINMMTIANVKHSTVNVKTPKRYYKINDLIKVSIILHDGLGKRILRGGDGVRIWIKEPARGACATGYTIDNRNGTYTGVVQVLWAGFVEILVGIAIPREAIRLLYTIHREGYLVRQMFAMFQRRHAYEMTLCAYTPHLPYKRVCNLTEMNYMLPWYCGHPDFLTCAEWTRTGGSQPPWPLNNDDRHVFDEQYIHQHIPQTNRISVVSEKNERLETLPPCDTISPTETWNQKSPVGYFIHWKWKPTFCDNRLPNTVDAWDECMSNRRVWMHGDSTMRQWFSYLQTRQNLNLLTDKWAYKQWPYPSMSHSKEHNYVIFWATHELPFTNTEEFVLRGAHKPTHMYIEELPADNRDIVIVNLYLHFTAYPPTLVRTHVRRIVQSVKSLLSRAPEAKVFVKGAHAFHDHSYARGVIDDHWGQIYTQIYTKEFEEIQDKVYFLDLWDMSVAAECDDVHPNRTVFQAQIHTLLGFICP